MLLLIVVDAATPKFLCLKSKNETAATGQIAERTLLFAITEFNPQKAIQTESRSILRRMRNGQF